MKKEVMPIDEEKLIEQMKASAATSESANPKFDSRYTLNIDDLQFIFTTIENASFTGKQVDAAFIVKEKIKYNASYLHETQKK